MRRGEVYRRATSGVSGDILPGYRERPGLGAFGRFVGTTAIALAILVIGGSLLAIGYVERTYGARYSAIPERPERIALVDLVVNREARRGPPPGLERWRDAGRELGFEIEALLVASLADLDPERYGAIVLPEQERLDDPEWERAIGLARAGAGLIFTGHPGLQRGDGRRRDGMLLASLLPGGHFRRLARPATALRVEVRGPLVAGFAPGERLALAAARAALASGPGTLDWETGDGAPAAGALRRGTVEDAPFVWMSPGAAEFADEEQARKLLQNLLRWAAREPVAELRPWPAGASAAVLIGAEADVLEGLARVGFRHPTRPGVALDIADTDVLLGRLLAEFAAVETRAGLYAALDSDPWLERSDRVRLEEILLRELESRHVWIARGSAIVDWWASRSRVAVVLERPRSGFAELTVTNRGDEPIANATARVYLPPPARPPTEVESSSFLTRPLLRVASHRGWIDLVTPELDAGETLTYSFAF